MALKAAQAERMPISNDARPFIGTDADRLLLLLDSKV